MKNILALFIFLFTAGTISAQDYSLYRKELFISGKDTMPYRLLLPENYSPGKTYPLILFLHGAGERGNDNESQLVHGGNLFLKDSIRKNFPAIVVFPQCSADSYWSNIIPKYDSTGKRIGFVFSDGGTPTKAMRLLMELFHQLHKKFKIDKRMEYAGGLSMGGMGTFEIVNRNPGVFAAAFAICGGANPETAKNISTTAWWIFHGLKDDVVNPEYSIDMANALKAAGADVKLTLYPEANHNSWDSAFAEPDFLPWLWSHRLK